MQSSAHVLGLDPGMASVGWAVMRLYRDGAIEFVKAGVLATAKSDKKLSVRSTDDNFRRAREISTFFHSIAGEYDVRAVAAEAMSFPRSSSVAAKMAMCWGALSMLTVVRDPLPLLQATPQEIKVAVCGAKSASKEEVQAALIKQFPALEVELAALKKAHREHPADACGAVMSVLATAEIRTLRAMLPA